jgi:hypothetical protein
LAHLKRPETKKAPIQVPKMLLFRRLASAPAGIQTPNLLIRSHIRRLVKICEISLDLQQVY